jgi:glycosyltransferase involved in cell wall biosynthesis
MRPLRFCMITTFYPPYNFGGDGIGVQRLSRALVRRGHHVTVIHDVDAYNLLHRGPEPVPQPEPAGLEVHSLRSRLRTLSPVLTQQTGRPVVQGARIRRILAEQKFDVIHFNNVSLVGGPGVLPLGAGIKIYEAHEHWLVCPTHVLWRHGRELCTGKECLSCTLQHRRPPQLWRYTGNLDRELGHIDAFIAKSRFSRDKHHEFGFKRPMEVLPYFLPDPDEAAAPATSQAPHERPYFLFVGRLEKIKGLDDVIPLFRDYQDADLLIAGDGEYAGALRALANENPRVKFLGRVPVEELHGYYAHALAVVVPSVCFETFGIILIEAFKYGVPVIARRLGPFPEIMETARAGQLFGDSTELLASMRALQTSEQLRRQLGRAGYDAYVKNWSESAVVPQYLDLIRRVAEERGNTDIVEALSVEKVA